MEVGGSRDAESRPLCEELNGLDVVRSCRVHFTNLGYLWGNTQRIDWEPMELEINFFAEPQMFDHKNVLESIK